jgi:hypothetical protein
MSSQPTNPPADSGKDAENEMIQQLVKALEAMNRPDPTSSRRSSPEAEARLKDDINERLNDSPPITVAFPSCTDVLLSLIKMANSDEITGFFTDYFRFCDHRLLADTENLDTVLDQKLRNCTGKWFPGVTTSSCDDGGVEPGPELVAGSGSTTADNKSSTRFPPDWPPFWCFPPTCVTLDGKRHWYPKEDFPINARRRRLFIADLVWLFYFERLGIFQILGRILDDYAYTGNHPISNGSLRPEPEDDVIAVVLEAMVRQTEAGASSKVRDRNSTYQRALGWTSEAGRKLNQNTRANREFTKYLHQFIAKALEFYRDKRLAVAIQSAGSTSAQPSTETLTAISVTLGELKKTFERFHYGRNYNNTLSGIVWVIGGMALIEKLKEDLGIPRAYGSPHEFIPAAYNIVVLEDKNAPLETSRYENHKICAESGRDILLDIEMIDHTNPAAGGELDLWLNIIEGKIEAYRTAYRSLTGTDLGARTTPPIEQEI